MMAEMYAARADSGLLISEATDIMADNHGYPNTPGLFTPAQVEGWRAVTSAVHAKGGLIVAQLWHQGRTASAELSGGPEGVVTASAIEGWLNGYGQPQPLSREASGADIARIVAGYAAAAAKAVDAGFDGVEIHAANGYLINQFLLTGSNRRTDGYGGSAANRARLLREVVAATTAAIGAERVGIRLSPGAEWQGMHDEDPVATFTQVVTDLAHAGLAYVHWIEPRDSGFGEPTDARKKALTSAWARAQGLTSPIITAGGYVTIEAADEAIAAGADAVAFGRLYIANPDLVKRVQRQAATAAPVKLNEWDRSTFYGGDERGYTTGYPLLG